MSSICVFCKTYYCDFLSKIATTNPTIDITMLKFRSPTLDDLDKVRQLYRKVARLSGGIARREKEITTTYVRKFMKGAAASGFHLVVDHPHNREMIIGDLHCQTLTPKAFSHVLGALTIAIDPDFQGQGIGKILLQKLLNFVEQKRPDILRVELYTNESNHHALALYDKMGFNREGKMIGKIRTHDGNITSDIPLAWFNPNFYLRRINNNFGTNFIG